MTQSTARPRLAPLTMHSVTLMTRLRRMALAAGALCAAAVMTAAAAVSAAAAEEPLRYNRDVRPILADTCFKCHGPDSAARKADLRMDKRDAAESLLNPGHPEESEVLRRILTDNADEIMPPADSKKVLTAEQKEILRRWITEGAQYEPHWSFIAPQPANPPAVQNAAWVRNPIDQYVLAALEARGLTPAPEADARTLARRLSLDLTGLPPSPELVEEFVNNPSVNAYEELVDKLLASDRWGEHRGRYWLDAARYADTHGIHFDNFREMWSYRDWVINAFNRNLPFDQFTIEQLAGDLLPQPTLEQQVATGFNRCNITTNEGGTIPEEYLVLYTRDRTETVSQVWLGMTANCCTCHDHKYDPLTQREFYEMAAFFNNTTQPAMDGNIKDTQPIVSVPLEADRPRFEALSPEIASVQSQLEARKPVARAEFDTWLAAARPDAFSSQLPAENLHAFLPLHTQGVLTSVQVDGQSRAVAVAGTAAWEAAFGKHAIVCTQGQVVELPDVGDFEKDQPFSCSAWVKLPANDSAGAIASRMDDSQDYRGWDFWVQARRVGMHIVNRWNQDALKVVSQNQVPANEWVHVAVTYDGSAKAAGVKVYINGEPQATNVESDTLQSTIRTGVPFKVGQRNKTALMSGMSLHDLRVYRQALTPGNAQALAKSSRYGSLIAKPAAERTPQELDELFAWYLGAMDQPHLNLTTQLAGLERELADIRARGTIAHIAQEKTDPAMAYILFRGEYDKRRDEVRPDTPDILPPLPAESPKNRLGFAQWLLRPDHPLTARVTVNRFWQEVFGTGLVRTTGDFGVMGELPTHPELLDYLAVDFRDHGWEMKRFFKQLVMSATYRQAAITTPDKLEKDPQNRFLSRGPRFRMDAEMVRDYTLAASGLLVPKIGGPSVKPYQPDGVWEAVAMIGSNTRDYRRDTGESLYRRSMYTFWKRAAPPAMLDVFNAPNREFCVVRRERTNTPLQALATLNDEQYIEAARHLAEKVLKESSGDFAARANQMALQILARPFKPEELAVVEQSHATLNQHYAAHPEDASLVIAVGESKPGQDMDPVALATWTMLANEMFNLDETLNK